MFLKSSSLPLAPVSGFVAFDGGGTMPLPAPARARAIARAPHVVDAPVPADAAAPAVELGLPQSATWQPGSSGRVRRVESAVLIAVCGYFAYGLGRVLGWV